MNIFFGKIESTEILNFLFCRDLCSTYQINSNLADPFQTTYDDQNKNCKNCKINTTGKWPQQIKKFHRKQ